VDEEEETDESVVQQQVHYVLNSSLASDPSLPKSFKAASSGPESEQWQEATKSEIKNFND
jgi:hypothetical protein